MHRRTFSALVGIAGLALAAAPAAPVPSIPRIAVESGSRYLVVEVLSDQLIHVELGAHGPPPDLGRPLYVTPYVDPRGYPERFEGPAVLREDGTALRTAAVRLAVDADSLCVSLRDLRRRVELTRICPRNLDQEPKGLTIARKSMRNAYGLGEFFPPSRIGSADGDWVGEVRRPGNAEGNALTPFNGGSTGNAQFPVLYALGRQGENYALLLDHVYAQTWDFRADPWVVETSGDPIRFFLIAGRDLPELRRTYMELVGRPPVPPRKFFGLWVSEYGFNGWDELRDKLRTLQANDFPVDGFVLDVQWFGHVLFSGEASRMGSLTFDETHFPDPAGTIAELRDREGVGIITIEEPYVAKGLPEHAWLEAAGYLARKSQASNEAFYIDVFPWWGLGGLIDFTHPAGGDTWHDRKRQPLVGLGVMGHWSDLGEPEQYTTRADPAARAWYYGFPELGKFREADVHNVYSLKWSESIWRGYQRNGVTRRPFILSRSGGSGIQRYGTAMWSGDIASNPGSLATHMNVQMHVSLSGLDYFGADIGGFWRSGLVLEGADLNDLYTQWFADGAALDVPVRPHTFNLGNPFETAPDRVGDRASNLANLRLRYELIPYYYSLAHRAYRFGEPVVPPLVHYYQDAPSDRWDLQVRTLGSEKLIGRDLLVAVVARNGAQTRDVYLPPGEWVDYHTHERHRSDGTSLRGHPVSRDGVLRLPLFARAGAIIPKMHVDAETMNALGKRRDGSVRNELIARVYADRTASAFTVYEDDGETTAYQNGAVATTEIRQRLAGGGVRVVFEPTEGDYPGAPSRRAYVVELVLPPRAARRLDEVRLNGRRLPQLSSREALDAAESGWQQSDGSPLVVVKSGPQHTRARKVFRFLLRGRERSDTP